MEVPYVFITDNGYVVPTVVAITSLINNSNSVNKIFIIYPELTDENKEVLKQTGNINNSVELIQFNPADINQYKNDSLYVTPTSLIKFEIANILKDYKKVIYLDGDIIIKNDITPLKSVNVGNFYCCAVLDYESSVDNLSARRLRLSKYFNSGVMVLNLELIRREELSKRMFSIKKERKDLYYMDQDVLNLTFQDNVFWLPVKYNYIHNSFDDAKCNINDINVFFDSHYQSLQDIYNDCIVLHLAGGKKPWKSHLGTCYKIWREYFDKSPLKDMVLPNEVLPSVHQSLYNRILTQFIRKKNYINQKGEYEIAYFLGPFKVVSKIRTLKGVKYNFFGFICS